MQTYTIKETSNLTGLPESTLRYYEKMGLICPIERGLTNKHRLYNDENVNIISAIACLNITGMSIGNMKEYLNSIAIQSKDFETQLKLLKEQEKKINEEEKLMKLRKQYVKMKIKWWNLAKIGDEKGLKELRKEIDVVSKQLRLGNKK